MRGPHAFAPHPREASPPARAGTTEAVEFAPEGEPGLEATYLSSAYLGAVTEFMFDVGGTEVFATMYGGGLTDARKGDRVRLRLKQAGVSLLPPD